jgi:hypothetical protein
MGPDSSTCTLNCNCRCSARSSSFSELISCSDTSPFRSSVIRPCYIHSSAKTSRTPRYLAHTELSLSALSSLSLYWRLTSSALASSAVRRADTPVLALKKFSKPKIERTLYLLFHFLEPSHEVRVLSSKSSYFVIAGLHDNSDSTVKTILASTTSSKITRVRPTMINNAA